MLIIYDYIVIFFFQLLGVLSEATEFYFEKSILYSDVLPESGLISTNGQLSSITCAKLCADQKYCQTIFYKPMTNTCYLYKYPLLEYTPTSPEPAIEVYELKGMYFYYLK